MNELSDRIDGAIADGSAVDIASAAELLLASEPECDVVFTGRARHLMRALALAVVDLRDRGTVLDREAIVLHTGLPEMMRFARDTRLSDVARSEILRYLQDLPGFDAGRVEQLPMAYIQHGYARVYWQRLLRREAQVA